MDDIILIGAGGHSKVIQDIISSSKTGRIHAILDDAITARKVENGVIYSDMSFINEINIMDFKYCICIGSNRVRETIYNKMNLPIENYITLIHPTAVISKSAKLGFGTVVMANAIINADTTVGNHCIINSGAVVEHDNRIGDFVHISPNSTLTGTVTIGDGSHIGAGSTIIPGKQVGSWATIGAGAVVIENIESHVTAVGIPAKVIK